MCPEATLLTFIHQPHPPVLAETFSQGTSLKAVDIFNGRVAFFLFLGELLF